MTIGGSWDGEVPLGYLSGPSVVTGILICVRRRIMVREEMSDKRQRLK